METLLNFTFEHAGSLRLVKASDFEDLGRVKPAVCASSHYRNTIDDPAAEGESSVRQEHTTRGLTFRRREHHYMWPRSGSPQTIADRAFHPSLTLNICTGAIAGQESNKTGYLAAQIILDSQTDRQTNRLRRPLSALGTAACYCAIVTKRKGPSDKGTERTEGNLPKLPKLQGTKGNSAGVFMGSSLAARRATETETGR